MTINAPDTRQVEQLTGTVLTGEGLIQANEQLQAAEIARLTRRLADVTAELDNMAPSKIKLLDAMRSLMDETVNYKKQADDFEHQAETLRDENSELHCRVQELTEELDELRTAPVPKLAR